MEKSKKKIKKWQDQIYNLQEKITEEANQAMEEAGIKINAYDLFSNKEIPDVYDSAQWFHISTVWDCPKSPFGYCMYHIIHDKAKDGCAFCGQPYERK